MDENKAGKKEEKQRKSEQSRDETPQHPSHLITTTTTHEAGRKKNLHLSIPSRAPPLTTGKRLKLHSPQHLLPPVGGRAHLALLHLPLRPESSLQLCG